MVFSNNLIEDPDQDLPEVSSHNLEYEDDVLSSYNSINATKWLIENYFLCNTPYDQIIDKLSDQCNDYINTVDDENYFTMFFNAMQISLLNLEDDTEEYPDEARGALRDLQSDFEEKMIGLLEENVGIMLFNLETMTIDERLIILQEVYEYFILNAKTNFKIVISEYINKMTDVEEKQYIEAVQELIDNNFMGLITSVTPSSFIFVSDSSKKIFDYFESNTITGNFLNKYHPALYKNLAFKNDVINYTAMMRMLHQQ